MKYISLLFFVAFSLNAQVVVSPGPGAGSKSNATALQGTAISSTAPTNGQVLTYNATTASWRPSAAAGGGVDTLATVGSTPAAAGASISGTTLTLQPADASNAGVISTTTQTMGAGAKTFGGAVTMSAGSLTITPATDVGAVTINAKGSGNGAVITMDGTTNSAGGRSFTFFSSGSGNGDVGGGKWAVRDSATGGLPGYILLVDGANGRVGIGGVVPGAGPFVVKAPTAQTIADTNTVAADACGTIKRISSAGGVTTNTTNTFTNATTLGCCMDVVNTGSNSITLDNNANFFSAGAADVALGAGDSVRVCSDGAVWYQVGATGNN